ncbi:hypothetical protein F5146DRAFT_1060442 [Armillaria mellea]|nr:hypothetical protein F5146DRAFT_1060442 [Armillaria mellea]
MTTLFIELRDRASGPQRDSSLLFVVLLSRMVYHAYTLQEFSLPSRKLFFSTVGRYIELPFSIYLVGLGSCSPAHHLMVIIFFW